MFGSHNSQVATLVERHTRYVMLVPVKSKDTETAINAQVKQAHKLPRELYKSLTWNRSKAMADHKRFSLATDIKVYYCDNTSQRAWPYRMSIRTTLMQSQDDLTSGQDKR